MANLIFFIILFSLECALFYFLPTLNAQNTLFGINLENDDFQTYGLPILRKYRRDLTIIAVLGAVVFALICLTQNVSENSLGIAYILITIAIIFPLFKYLRQTWKLRDKRIISKLASPLKPRLLRDFSNFWIELMIVVFSLAPFIILKIYYSSLPEIVPIHWNAAGEPDGFAKKSFFTIFFLPVLCAFLQIFFVILKQDIIQARFRVPAEQAEKILSLKELSLESNVGLIDWCRLIVGAMLGIVSLLVLSPIVPPSVTFALNMSVWAVLILLLTGIAFYLYRMILINREVKSLTGQITFQTADELRGWTNGLLYYNPQDAAFMVEKPGGMGYTINFAHRRAYLYLAFLFLPVCLTFLSVAFL